MTLPVFALDSNPYEIKLWDGNPADGGRLIAVLPYQEPSIWNVYQSETYHLPERLTGVHTLCFSLTSKIHLKGFSFEKQSRAWLPQTAQDADTVYGDSFTRSGSAVTGIGNNALLCGRTWISAHPPMRNSAWTDRRRFQRTPSRFASPIRRANS